MLVNIHFQKYNRHNGYTYNGYNGYTFENVCWLAYETSRL